MSLARGRQVPRSDGEGRGGISPGLMLGGGEDRSPGLMLEEGEDRYPGLILGGGEDTS